MPKKRAKKVGNSRSEKTRNLTAKQELFIEAYLGQAKGNLAEAARLAGYKGNAKTLSAMGAENLEKPGIARAIADRMRQAKACLDADQVLERLTSHATATIDDFLDEQGNMDLEKARKAGKMHLLKSISWTKFGARIELYDAQAAAVHLGRYHKLFTDKFEIDARAALANLLGISPEDIQGGGDAQP